MVKAFETEEFYGLRYTQSRGKEKQEIKKSLNGKGRGEEKVR